MNRILLFISIVFANIGVANASNSLDSLLNILDETVANRAHYTSAKEKSIETLKAQYKSAGALAQQYSILGQLFDLYGNFKTDSAYSVVIKRLEVAEKMGQRAQLAEAYMNLVEVYRTTGMYNEALETLDRIKKNNWHVEDIAYYYHLNHSLYMLMADFAVLETDKRSYSRQVFNFKDSILSVLDPSELSYHLVLSSRHTMLGEYDKALEVAESALVRFGSSSPLITYTIAEIYSFKNNHEMEKYFLACSAISDLRSGIKEYMSLHRLASRLYEEGNLNRVYNYMQCAMEDAVFSNSRLRTLEVSKLLPIITESYNSKMKQERERLIIGFATIFILLIGLLIAFAFIYKQVKLLSINREHQKQMNMELKRINNQLLELNNELTDANVVKEEYIGYVFKLCSDFITKLEDFRVFVSRNIKTNQIKNINKVVSSSSFVSEELKEFYKNFDSVFLNIYPTFVEQFNKLLNDDEQIVLKEGELLTPELRIFALVRLGINDSVKIAEFLHYSPQTIYNYRNKIRNKSDIPKGEFTEAVYRIERSSSSD